MELDDFGRKQVLTSLYNDILARDISSRYGASYEITDRICRFMLTNQGALYSSNSVAQATGTAVETAEKYIGYLKESLLIYELPIFSFKLKLQFKQNKKTYPADTGIRNAVCLRFSQDAGKLAETAVFLEIKRRNDEVYYWKSNGGYEVDFVVHADLEVASHPTERHTIKCFAFDVIIYLDFVRVHNKNLSSSFFCRLPP